MVVLLGAVVFGEGGVFDLPIWLAVGGVFASGLVLLAAGLLGIYNPSVGREIVTLAGVGMITASGLFCHWLTEDQDH